MVLRISRTMVSVTTCCVLMLLICSQAHCRQSDRRRKDKIGGYVSSSHPYKTNVCQMNDRESKVHCYCEDAHGLQNASTANCWVFNGGLEIDEPIWSAFSSQSNLIELEFSVRADGGLNFVPERALRPLRYLRKFTIQYGNIDQVLSYSLANSSSLKEIDLSKNKIFDMQEHAIALLPNLTILTLDDNRLSELKRNTFYELPSLQKLYITNNNISLVHDGAFKQLTSLVELELEHNSITTLTRESFEGLANLRKLDLSDNRINMLGELTFAELWNLHELYLDKNILQYIAERAFDGLSQLKRLSLCDNRLNTLTIGLFEGIRGLTSLDLQQNQLDTLTFDVIRPLIENMKNATSYLNLEGNNFDCDCRLSWMHMLRNDTKSEKVKTSLEQVTCHLELEFNEHLIPIIQKYNKAGKAHKHHKKQQQHHQQQQQHRHSDASYDTFEQRLDEYDDVQQDTVQSTTADTNKIHLFQLPMEMLPCPSELVDSTDAPLSPLSQGEVRDYRNSANTHSKISVFSVLLLSFATSTISF